VCGIFLVMLFKEQNLTLNKFKILKLFKLNQKTTKNDLKHPLNSVQLIKKKNIYKIAIGFFYNYVIIA